MLWMLLRKLPELMKNYLHIKRIQFIAGGKTSFWLETFFKFHNPNYKLSIPIRWNFIQHTLHFTYHRSVFVYFDSHFLLCYMKWTWSDSFDFISPLIDHSTSIWLIFWKIWKLRVSLIGVNCLQQHLIFTKIIWETAWEKKKETFWAKLEIYAFI